VPVRLRVRVSPRSSGEGVVAAPDGVPVVRVTAAPVDGKANAAVCRVVAKKLGLPKSAVRCVSGESARVKTLEIKGATPEAVERLSHAD